MGDKIIYIVITVLTIGIFGVILFLNGDPSKFSTTSHIYGKQDSVVTLIEYGDFQCPACFQYFPALREVKEKYKDQIAFQFRHFPIVRAHPNAMAAHRAAEAASRQGKFWEMHDLLYERQKSWAQEINPEKIFKDYADELGLDLDEYQVDQSSDDNEGVINADSAQGKKDGATGTPSFILNGEKIENPEPTLEDFSIIIDQKLAEL
ncbi:thioredoxin domain-containing protein [Candidatus Berkelbacteria bacterium]|nr:thioredoxin domain-containing protein [Candidatus Berkelbacteria bacterium]